MSGNNKLKKNNKNIKKKEAFNHLLFSKRDFFLFFVELLSLSTQHIIYKE